MSLNVSDGKQALEFYAQAFGAEPVESVFTEEGILLHAEMKVGESRLMFSSEIPEMDAPSAARVGASPTLQCIETDEVDALYEQAVAAGAEVLMPLADQFWGARCATLRDPFGYRWNLTKQIREVSAEEVIRGAKEMMG